MWVVTGGGHREPEQSAFERSKLHEPTQDRLKQEGIFRRKKEVEA